PSDKLNHSFGILSWNILKTVSEFLTEVPVSRFSEYAEMHRVKSVEGNCCFILGDEPNSPSQNLLLLELLLHLSTLRFALSRRNYWMIFGFVRSNRHLRKEIQDSSSSKENVSECGGGDCSCAMFDGLLNLKKKKKRKTEYNENSFFEASFL
ncbi:hypothetical protein HAX54_002250, partial [Datura stramonium]|nr:hypothetical protein [Datura stramonium]